MDSPGRKHRGGRATLRVSVAVYGRRFEDEPIWRSPPGGGAGFEQACPNWVFRTAALWIAQEWPRLLASARVVTRGQNVAIPNFRLQDGLVVPNFGPLGSEPRDGAPWNLNP